MQTALQYQRRIVRALSILKQGRKTSLFQMIKDKKIPPIFLSLSLSFLKSVFIVIKWTETYSCPTLFWSLLI